MDSMTEIKLAALIGVREHTEKEQVELWLNESRRVVVRCYNECRNNYTDLDLSDLLNWARNGNAELTSLSAPERD
jgi:hypothetical protein